MTEENKAPETFYEAFKFGATAQAIQPMVLQAECTCGQRIATIAGLALTLDVAEGMDLVAVCRCGRSHSMATQSANVKKAIAALQEARDRVAGNSVAENAAAAVAAVVEAE